MKAARNWMLYNQMDALIAGGENHASLFSD